MIGPKRAETMKKYLQRVIKYKYIYRQRELYTHARKEHFHWFQWQTETTIAPGKLDEWVK